jgi:hypothetical protein
MSAYQVTELVDQHGQHYPLQSASSSVGRGTECDIRLGDALASRRHFQLQQTPAGWQITDLGSSNGTFLNGRRLRPGEATPVALGDRITLGRTTLVVQLAPARAPQAVAAQPRPQPAPLQSAAVAVPRQPINRMAGASQAAEGIPLWQWITAALVTAGALLAAVGVFQPWVRVDIRFTLRNLPMGDLLEKAKDIAARLFQQLTGAPPPAMSHSLVIQGMDGYGPVLLLAAGLALLAIVFDLTLRLTRSVAPGVICVLSGIAPAVVLAVSAERFVRLGHWDILFGVNLLELLQIAEKLTEATVTPLSGLYLTGLGLALLLAAGIFRMAAPLLFRRQTG